MKGIAKKHAVIFLEYLAVIVISHLAIKFFFTSQKLLNSVRFT